MSDNDNLELKKRSRRRLVGAAALALIAALVLPMVMDDEPTVAVPDIQVTLPESTVDARPIASRDPIAEPIPDSPAALVESTPAAPEAEQAGRPVMPEAPAASKSEPAPKPQPEPAPTAKPPVAQPAPAQQESAEAQRARAILEGRASPPPQAAAADSTQFLVQVGAFSDLAKAQARQSELAARGFKAFIETNGGVSRVRLGPFAARADAEAVITRLRAASLDGVVTTR